MNLTLPYSETHRHAYSHPGLEATYTIQNIDLNTVKLLNETIDSPITLSDITVSAFQQDRLNPLQLEFDFGGEFRCWIQSYILEEPIQVLNLSFQAEKLLQAYAKSHLKDLVELESQHFSPLRGMGQGHIDEIKQKLQEYLDKHLSTQTNKIDFISLIRILLGSLPRKGAYLLLEKFDLVELCSLSPAENVEVKRMSLEDRLKIGQDIQQELCISKNIHILHDILLDFTNVLIKPWMRKRQGFATKEELMERLMRSCRSPEFMQRILNLLSEVFFQGHFILKNYLIEVQPQLYAVDQDMSFSYYSLTRKILTYFYHPDNSYSLEELTKFVQNEFAKGWEDYSELLISKVLLLSSLFRMRKNEHGQLMVRLA